MSNSVNLSLDVAKTGIQNPLIKVRQGDGGFETLHTTVTSNGEPMNLQGWTITFMGTTAGNHKIVDGNVKVIEAPNGIFDYTPSKSWGMDIGEFKIAYFKFVKGDGSASSANFRVNVIEAVDLTQEEAQNYISVVDTTIAEINQHLTNSLANVTKSIADANTNANTVASNVNSLGNRVDDYNNKLADVQVGGRNYIINSSGLNASDATRPSVMPNSTTSTFVNATISYSGSATTLTYTGTGSQEWYYALAEAFKTYDSAKLYKTKQYTISVDVKGTAPGVSFRINDVYSSTVPLLSDTWSELKYTFKFQDLGGTNTDKFYIRVNAIGGINNRNFVQGQTLSFRNFKLEEGNIATDWTPAPEDAPSNDSQLVHKTGTETIAGDKTFTSPINGRLSGNAETATKWQTARTLALTGDVTGSVAVDGSGNVSMATTGANLVHKGGSETIAGDKTFTGVTNIQNQKQYKSSFTIGANTINLTRIGSTVYVNARIKEKINAGSSYGVIPAGFTPANSAVISFIVNNTQGSCLFQANQNNVWFPADAPFDSNMSGSYLTSDALPS